MPLPFEPLTNPILEAAFEVYQELGPGFMEPVYENALFIALKDKGLMVERQVPVLVRFRGQLVGTHHIDLLVSQEVAVEVKADPELTQEQATRMLNHLKASGRPVGIYVNFGTPKLEWRRIFNRMGPEDLEDNLQDG
ncbi:MAG: hypothetical protein H6Q00_1228 [Holophagaceae bacterium]|nr:hypothetical protein [Holophagaceae bacterium]